MTQEQWKAIAAKDRKADGQFWYALQGGRTFCRPSCRTKSPRAERILIFSSCQEAVKAGYRPCRVCRPDQMDWRGSRAEIVQRAKNYMEDHMLEKFSLQTMADALHTDGSYLLKIFHEETGHTLLWFHREIRIREACEMLENTDASVAEIASMLGFSTPALFSRVFAQMRGVSPRAYRKKHAESENSDQEAFIF